MRGPSGLRRVHRHAFHTRRVSAAPGSLHFLAGFFVHLGCRRNRNCAHPRSEGDELCRRWTAASPKSIFRQLFAIEFPDTTGVAILERSSVRDPHLGFRKMRPFIAGQRERPRAAAISGNPVSDPTPSVPCRLNLPPSGHGGERRVRARSSVSAGTVAGLEDPGA